MGGVARAAALTCRALLLLAVAAGVVMTGFVALSAFMRYLVGAPLAFTEELVGLLFAAMVFLALPFCSLHDRHIRVTLLHDLLSPGHRRVARLAGLLFVLLFCAVYGWHAFEFAELSRRLRSSTDIGGLILWPWMALLPVSCALMALASLLREFAPVTEQPAQPERIAEPV